MTEFGKLVDTYIAKSADFAKPILTHLRKLVHRACPDIEETIKWGFPHFDYQGMMCSMAAFKQHCAFSFWKASLMSDTEKVFSKAGKTAMGNLGRIQALSDLPPDRVLIRYIKEAVELNKSGIELSPKARPGIRKPLTIPSYFKRALATNSKARRTFEAFSPGHKREYVEWIVEARTEPTRNQRIAQALEWMAEGKQQNWKYAKKSMLMRSQTKGPT